MALLNDAQNIYMGATAVKKVYAGSDLIWQRQSWSPSDLTGLSIWLDASVLPGVPASSLNSWPNLVDAVKPGVMVGTPVPIISENMLNGKKLVRFFANQGRLRIIGLNITYAHTLVYISRIVGPIPGRVVCAAYPPPNYLIGWWNGYMDVAYSTTGSFFTPDTRKSWNAEGTPTPWIMYSGDADDPPNYRPRMFRNGVFLSGGGSDGSVSSGDSFRNTFNISGYSPDGPEETCDCEVAEVCVYNRRLSDPDRQLVENYLRTKWGL